MNKVIWDSEWGTNQVLAWDIDADYKRAHFKTYAHALANAR